VLGHVKTSLPALPVFCQRSLQDCLECFNLFRRSGSRTVAALLWVLEEDLQKETKHEW
jgi:hypothetical protein